MVTGTITLQPCGTTLLVRSLISTGARANRKLNQRILPCIGRLVVVMSGNAFRICRVLCRVLIASRTLGIRPFGTRFEIPPGETFRRLPNIASFSFVSCWRVDLARNLDSVRAPADSVDGERETRFLMRSRLIARRPKLRPRTSGRRRSKMDRLVEFAYRLPSIV
jgi:hypothetical protein